MTRTLRLSPLVACLAAATPAWAEPPKESPAESGCAAPHDALGVFHWHMDECWRYFERGEKVPAEPDARCRAAFEAVIANERSEWQRKCLLDQDRFAHLPAPVREKAMALLDEMCLATTYPAFTSAATRFSRFVESDDVTALIESSKPKEERATEAKAYMKAAFVVEKAYYQEYDRYSPLLSEVGFSPERSNRYAYYFAPEGPAQKRDATKIAEDTTPPGMVIVAVDLLKYPQEKFYATAKETGCPITPGKTSHGRTYGLGVSGTGDDQAFLILAAGNIDADPDLDCWSVASTARTVADGTIISAGEPYHEKSD